MIVAQHLKPEKLIGLSILSKKVPSKKTQYNSLEEMNIDLMNFLVHYNLYRRHGSLRRELKVKTPFDAVEKWHELDPLIFKQKISHFKQKTLNLKLNNQTSSNQQPCKT